jgi:hypothetical protein
MVSEVNFEGATENVGSEGHKKIYHRENIWKTIC